MAVTSDHLSAASEVFGVAAPLREAANVWRTRFPELRVVLVDAMDMRDETPTLLLAGSRRVYLAATNGHCWSITKQPEEATAFILTQDD